MEKVQIDQLARRLEEAHRLSRPQQEALYRDLERYARQDLYGASRLCKDHMTRGADFRLPTVVMAADRIAKHFEMRTHQPRRPLDVYAESDRQIRQPEDGRRYEGPVVGLTPACVVQRDRDTGDYIVHARATLNREFGPTGPSTEVSIHYPFKAVGGAGLVSTLEPAFQRQHGIEHAHELSHAGRASGMEMGR